VGRARTRLRDATIIRTQSFQSYEQRLRSFAFTTSSIERSRICTFARSTFGRGKQLAFNIVRVLLNSCLKRNIYSRNNSSVVVVGISCLKWLRSHTAFCVRRLRRDLNQCPLSECQSAAPTASDRSNL